MGVDSIALKLYQSLDNTNIESRFWTTVSDFWDSYLATADIVTAIRYEAVWYGREEPDEHFRVRVGERAVKRLFKRHHDSLYFPVLANKATTIGYIVGFFTLTIPVLMVRLAEALAKDGRTILK